MCNINCLVFAVKHLSQKEVKGKKIIEIGSLNVNGSLRPVLESWQPDKYLGIDLQKGPGVDMVCRVEEMVEVLGKESFDLVVATELLEHIKSWRLAISNIKNICKPGGTILITTRSIGFGYHGYPNDFWRYELKDMKKIFSDCRILALEKDSLKPGVFAKVKKV